MNDRMSAWLHYQAAQVLSAFRLYERAIGEFKVALAHDPRSAAAWRCMGFLQAERGDDAGAIQSLAAALRLDPDDAVTRFNLGFIYHRRHRYADAIAEFERAVQLRPTNDRGWYGLGLCREASGDLERAVDALKEAARLQYFNPHAGYHLALLYHRLGRRADVLSEYERIKSFDPKFAEQIRSETGIAPRAPT